ncbi:putative T6SS immunity periplasmic lipoprotein [Rahnella aquatilis]|uniref:putative T6SS immunity periplasmic lipoprotein n=1 Tax=Rahnella aquatilis TaxID=34038 RepID=UPI0036654D6E
MGDKIPWSTAEIKQDGKNVCALPPKIHNNYVYERLKIQKPGSKTEFAVYISGRVSAKEKCLPLMGSKFTPGEKYNVNFSVINTVNGNRNVYSATFINSY